MMLPCTASRSCGLRSAGMAEIERLPARAAAQSSSRHAAVLCTCRSGMSSTSSDRPPAGAAGCRCAARRAPLAAAAPTFHKQQHCSLCKRRPRHSVPATTASKAAAEQQVAAELPDSREQSVRLCHVHSIPEAVQVLVQEVVYLHQPAPSSRVHLTSVSTPQHSWPACRYSRRLKR